MKRYVPLLFGILAIIACATTKAKADVPCYAIMEIGHSCNPNQYYCSEYEEDTCIAGGCNGPTCNTGYGYCCGHQYPTQVVSGDPDLCGSNCLDGEVRFPKDLAVDRHYHKRNPVLSAKTTNFVPTVAYYVPSRCNHLFGVHEPAELYKTTPGM